MTEQSVRKKRIIEVARKVFAQKGYHLTTIDEVAKRTGIAKGTVYLYFPSKEKLFLEVLKDGMEGLREKIFQEIKGIDDPKEKIERLIYISLQFFEKHRSLFRTMLLGDIPRGEHKKTAKKAFKGYEEFMDWLSDIMREGIEKGVLRELKPQWLAIAFIGIMKDFLLHFIRKDGKTKLTEYYPVISQLFFKGALKEVK